MQENLSLSSFTVCCGYVAVVSLCNICTEHDYDEAPDEYVTFFLDTVMLKTDTACIVLRKLSASSLIKFWVLIYMIHSYDSPEGTATNHEKPRPG
jgi:hypothetical protein